jgi:hypothetical protein
LVKVGAVQSFAETGDSAFMRPSINDPEHWRARAQEMRALAEKTDDPLARTSMLAVAAEYEKLAHRAEQRSDGRQTQQQQQPQPQSVRRKRNPGAKAVDSNAGVPRQLSGRL